MKKAPLLEIARLPAQDGLWRRAAIFSVLRCLGSTLNEALRRALHSMQRDFAGAGPRHQLVDGLARRLALV